MTLLTNNIDDEAAPLLDEINLIPMLDVVWVLLIVFMIVSAASIQGLSIDLPAAKNSQSISIDADSFVTLTLYASGDLELNGVLVPRSNLGTALSEYSDGNRTLIVRAASTTAYSRFIEILDELSVLDLKEIQFATVPKVGDVSE